MFSPFLFLLPHHQEVSDLPVNPGYLAVILYLNKAEMGGGGGDSLCASALNVYFVYVFSSNHVLSTCFTLK